MLPSLAFHVLKLETRWLPGPTTQNCHRLSRRSLIVPTSSGAKSSIVIVLRPRMNSTGIKHIELPAHMTSIYWFNMTIHPARRLRRTKRNFGNTVQPYPVRDDCVNQTCHLDPPLLFLAKKNAVPIQSRPHQQNLPGTASTGRTTSLDSPHLPTNYRLTPLYGTARQSLFFWNVPRWRS